MAKRVKAVCGVEECDRVVLCKGWCSMHYARAHKTGDPLGMFTYRWNGYVKPSCSVEGCWRTHSAKGFCRLHYRRNLANGDPGEVELRRVPGLSVPERWFDKVDKDGPIPTYAPFLGPCWCWRGKPNADGYGYMQVDYAGVLAHRLGYELLVGPIPEGLVLDHLCRVPICVRPSHLEPVTQRENILRGYGKAAQQARQQECVNGHPLVGPDARLYDDPRARICVLCHNAAQRALYYKRKAEREAADT